MIFGWRENCCAGTAIYRRAWRPWRPERVSVPTCRQSASRQAPRVQHYTTRTACYLTQYTQLCWVQPTGGWRVPHHVRCAHVARDVHVCGDCARAMTLAQNAIVFQRSRNVQYIYRIPFKYAEHIPRKCWLFL